MVNIQMALSDVSNTASALLFVVFDSQETHVFSLILQRGNLNISEARELDQGHVSIKFLS